MSRIARNTLRQLPLIRTYATPQQPPPMVDTTAAAEAESQGIEHPITASSSSSSLSISSPDRIYPVKKAFLFEYYRHLIRSSPLFLLFEYDNITVKEWKVIRNLIQNIPVPEAPPAPTPAPSAQPEKKTKTKKGKTVDTASKVIDPSAELMVVRTGLLGAATRSHSSSETMEPWLLGQRAVLYSKHLSPPYLKQILSAVKKGIKQSQREGSTAKQPKLNLIVGLVENRLMSAKQVEDVATLPDMKALRAQLVGSMESPGRSVLGLLGQAGGGSLLRTLQGLEQGMKDKQSGGEQKTEA